MQACARWLHQLMSQSFQITSRYSSAIWHSTSQTQNWRNSSNVSVHYQFCLMINVADIICSTWNLHVSSYITVMCYLGCFTDVLLFANEWAWSLTGCVWMWFACLEYGSVVDIRINRKIGTSPSGNNVGQKVSNLHWSKSYCLWYKCWRNSFHDCSGEDDVSELHE